ncbi:MAG: GntR family transcriptional regulator [Anaerolineaceae bacterium]
MFSAEVAIIKIQIDFRSGISIVNQIFEQINDQVIRGDLKPGDQLPTVRELAIELNVHFNTVARSYRLLDKAGLISTQHGRGTYILPTASPANKGRMEKLDQITKEYLLATQDLGVSAGEVLAVFHRNLKSYGNKDEQ